MATSRHSSRVNRVIEYRALVEFDGPANRHYVAGDLIATEGWSSETIEAAYARQLIELVEKQEVVEQEQVSQDEPDVEGGKAWQES